MKNQVPEQQGRLLIEIYLLVGEVDIDPVTTAAQLILSKVGQVYSSSTYIAWEIYYFSTQKKTWKSWQD